MVSKFIHTRLAIAGLAAASTAFAIAVGYSFTASHVAAQQAPATAGAPGRPGGRGGRGGGGFTQPDPIDFDNHVGWTQIFDGKTLNGWDGAPGIWHVEDGALVGESSPEHPAGSTNIIWRGGEPANFELKVEMKLEGTGANGGIQYRSSNVVANPPQMSAERLAQMTEEQKQQMQKNLEVRQKYAKWGMKGYQADFDYANRYTGQLYEQGTGRGIIAWPGQVVEADTGQKPRLLALLGTPDEIKSFIKPAGEWNQYEVIADGNTMVHIINGHVTAIFVDDDPTFSQSKGLIAFEIEGGGVVKISQRNVWLKNLP